MNSGTIGLGQTMVRERGNGNGCHEQWQNGKKITRNQKKWPLQFDNKILVIHFFELVGSMPCDDWSWEGHSCKTPEECKMCPDTFEKYTIAKNVSRHTLTILEKKRKEGNLLYTNPLSVLYVVS
jgi:hypothetical protein